MHYAQNQGMSAEIITGTRFEHRVFFHQGATAQRGIHIYIEGDGSPWVNGGATVARDPTPRNPLALHLMAASAHPSVYVGRPCYFDRNQSDGCDERYWTSARYSAEVVESMLTVITRLRSELQPVVLIGFSGGGTLAALLADRLEGPRLLITIAGNLNTDSWTEHHNYLPLTESLNPMTNVDLRGVRQVHLVGLRDQVVPAAQIEAFAMRHGGTLKRFDTFDHRCCWKNVWPSLLDELLAGRFNESPLYRESAPPGSAVR